VDCMPFNFEALAKVTLLRDGAFYPIGGSAEFAKTMIPTIEKTGGRVLVAAEVSEIIIENGKAVGVYLEKHDIEIRAKVVISGIGFRNTWSRLIPKETVQKYEPTIPRLLEEIPPSCGVITVFFGFNRSARELGIVNSTFFPYHSCDLDGDRQRFDEDPLNSPIPFYLITSSSARDPQWEVKHPGKSTIVVMTEVSSKFVDKYKNLPLKRRGQEYEAIKAYFAQKATEKIHELFPKTKELNAIDVVEVGTPITHNYYYGVTEGEAFGLSFPVVRQEPRLFEKLVPQTNIKGLYMTGQDTVASGVSTVMLAGTATAASILGIMNPRSLYT